MKLLIRDGVTFLSSAQSFARADIAVVGERIVGVGGEADLIRQHGEAKQVVEARGRVVIPGLINAHTHAYQAPFRGLADGLRLEQWQRQVMQPVYRYLTPDDTYWFTLAGAIENIRTGVTSILNFQAYPNDLPSLTKVAAALGESGLRALQVKSFYGPSRPDAPRSLRAFRKEVHEVFSGLHGSYSGRIRFCVGPPNALLAPRTWISTAHLIAKDYGSGVHTHLASTREQADRAARELGMPAANFLHSLGVMDERFIAAHCVALDDAEAAQLAACGAHISHCPISNMYLGDGIARVEDFRGRGINVALGSDGPATNNNQDMFVVMKVASLLQKAVWRDPRRLPPEATLEMATAGGARALGIASGTIEPGQLADLTIIDLGGIHNQPVHRPASTIVYSAHATDVESVIVAGELVMDRRRLLLVDEDEVGRQLRRRTHRIIREAGIAAPSEAPLELTPPPGQDS